MTFLRDDFWQQTVIFLSLTLRGLGIGMLISLPLGIVLSRVPRVAGPVMSALALLQTIPSLALLGFCVSVLGIFGQSAAVVAAVIYSIFPIVLNTVTGIMQIEPGTRDAARGMGMTPLQILRKVELPLALPVIMAGVRTGAVYAIGMITICSIVGARGLGDYIVTGITEGNNRLILQGIVPILIITMIFFGSLSGIRLLAKKHSAAGLRVAGVLVLLMASYGISNPIMRTHIAGTTLTEAAGAHGDSSLAGAWERTHDFCQQAALFLSLSLRGLGLALVLGLPIGVLLSRFRRAAPPVISVLALLQTIPSLALLGLCISLFSFLFGAAAAVFATVVYSLFPIVLNTYTGISQVNPRVRDAARGMGMTNRQILFKVELPLAMPVIIAGVRTAAIYAIGMTTIATFVGARGLGDYISDGMTRHDDGLILLGVIPILLLSFVFFWGLGGITWLAKHRPALGQVVSGVLILTTSGYALAEPFLRPPPADVRIGAKNFNEGLILGHILRLMVEFHTDLTVELFPNLGSNYAFKALRAGQIDMYPEYTGTLLTGKDALGDLPLPKDRTHMTDFVRRAMADRHQLTLLETFGLNNTYAFVVSRQLAERHGLKTIGDLQRTPQFRLVVDLVFMERPDGWKGLKELYGLNPKSLPQQVNPDLLYKALEKGKAEVVVGFATDWQIAAFDLVTLVDDKHYFPSYHGAPLVRAATLERYPQLATVLNRLANRIDDDKIREMSRQVAVEKRPADEVAHDFLRRAGLIGKASAPQR